MPFPRSCVEHAPESINVYSDGSWLFPLRQFLGLGGAAVVWPRRDLQTQPLSQAEIELTYLDDTDNGITLITAIGGYGGSSTRTELAAGIIAICADGPVHIGTDSAAFLAKATILLESIAYDFKVNTNFKTQSDGDLWEHFSSMPSRKVLTP